MNCPECDFKLEVVKTMVLGSVTQRLRECACGCRFLTVEKVLKKLPVTPSQPTANTQPTPLQTVALSSDYSLPVSDPIPPPPGNPIRARVESVKPLEFEQLWRETGRRGHKEQAFTAWQKQGKPPALEVIAAWKFYLASLEDWRSPKDLSGWLKLKGHKQEWTPAKKLPQDMRCHFHRSPGTLGKRPPAGYFAACPECKHARAGGGTRTGDPATMTDLVASTERKLAAARAINPATREQLEELRSADAKS